MSEFFELLKEQHELLENSVWDTALECYGIERNEESLARIHKSIGHLLEKLTGAAVASARLSPGESFEPIEDGLAGVFLCLGLFHRISDPQEALSVLATTYYGLGVVESFGKIKQGLPDGHGIDLAKMQAQAMAARRHAENYALAEAALKYWRENIDPKLSASKAAEELLRVVPLSHKKLAEVVAAEKKKQPR